MDSVYAEVPNSTKIGEAELMVSKAKSALLAVKALNHVTFIECRRGANNWEYIVFDAAPTIPQYGIKADIRYSERIAVGFDPVDEQYPEVFALRADFPGPGKVPHLNLRDFEFPKSLCLYEMPYAEVKLGFTAELFIERARKWLERAAIGTLHQEDQFLEPFFVDYEGIIILSDDAFKEQIGVKLISSYNGRAIYSVDKGVPGDSKYILLPLRCEESINGRIFRTPKSLGDLNVFLKELYPDFEKDLINSFRILHTLKLTGVKLIILISAAKKFSEEKTELQYDEYCFITQETVKEIGVSMGLWTEFEKKLCLNLFDKTNTESLVNHPVKTLKPLYPFNAKIAQFLNNIKPDKTAKILLVGIGALGSQIYNNLFRSGYGQWVIIDNDIFLPHNLSRHILTNKDIGLLKANSVSSLSNGVLNDPQFSHPLSIDVLTPQSQGSLIEVIEKNEVILDCSASVSVARHLNILAHKKARIISCFLNPAGSDLVILAEDAKQNHQIDYLEMQYYRFLLACDELKNHMQSSGEKKRYARSCRDLTSQIPQDHLSIFSGVASKEIKKIIESKDEACTIWSINKDTSEIKRFSAKSSKVHFQNKEKWKIYYDEDFLNTMATAREQKLPNETGGIIIGSYDSFRKIIYLVDVITSPSDSEEYPNSYKRGIKGLDIKLENISERTAGNLRYIGEWHSHPKGCSVLSSSDDKKNFEWIREVMKNEGLPPLSLIIGDRRTHSIFVEKMN